VKRIGADPTAARRYCKQFWQHRRAVCNHILCACKQMQRGIVEGAGVADGGTGVQRLDRQRQQKHHSHQRPPSGLERSHVDCARVQMWWGSAGGIWGERREGVTSRRGLCTQWCRFQGYIYAHELAPRHMLASYLVRVQRRCSREGCCWPLQARSKAGARGLAAHTYVRLQTYYQITHAGPWST